MSQRGTKHPEGSGHVGSGTEAIKNRERLFCVLPCSFVPLQGHIDLGPVEQAEPTQVIIAALSRQFVEDAWREYREQLTSLGVSALRAVPTLLWDLRLSLLTVVLAGFGRAASEVGAVMIVGGNIDGVTRVMTTTIALETSKGDLPLALSLGVILIVLVLALNAAAQVLKETARRRFG